MNWHHYSEQNGNYCIQSTVYKQGYCLNKTKLRAMIWWSHSNNTVSTGGVHCGVMLLSSHVQAKTYSPVFPTQPFSSLLYEGQVIHSLDIVIVDNIMNKNVSTSRQHTCQNCHYQFEPAIHHDTHYKLSAHKKSCLLFLKLIMKSTFQHIRPARLSTQPSGIKLCLTDRADNRLQAPINTYG